MLGALVVLWIFFPAEMLEDEIKLAVLVKEVGPLAEDREDAPMEPGNGVWEPLRQKEAEKEHRVGIAELRDFLRLKAEIALLRHCPQTFL